MSSEINGDLIEAIICDIDGTIADCSHRLHLIQGEVKKWGEFHAACKRDEEISAISWILKKLIDDPIGEPRLIYLTGRPEASRVFTEDWLRANDLPWGCRLFMRKDGDFRCDTEVKREIYEEHIRGKYEVLCVFEDRARVVKMWRELGLTCLQVAEGDY